MKLLKNLPKFSLKNKIILWFSISIIVVSFFILYAMTGITQSIVVKEVYNNLIHSVNKLEDQIHSVEDSNLLIPESFLYNEGVQMAIYTNEGRLIFGYTPFGFTDDVEFHSNYIQTVPFQGKTYYVYDKPVRYNTEYIIRGVVCITSGTSMLQTAVKYNILSIFLMVCIAIFGSYWLLNRAFAPILNMTNIAEDISKSNDLTRRIDTYDGDDEISSLTRVFNHMLERVESAFKKEKQFTSDASHELRTPITVILSECEYGAECVSTGNIDEISEVMSSIKEQATKMSNLVSELLMISRMDSNRLKLNFEDTNLSELLEFVCEEQEEIREPSIKLVKDIETNVSCAVDRLLMTRLFVNLISNAYQYSDNGTTITVSLHNQKDKVVFAVKDEGIGIAPENIEKIWDRFYQVDSSRTDDEEYSSSGLGLSMVKWIAEAHEGTITVESELGKGSIFTLSIPNASV